MEAKYVKMRLLFFNSAVIANSKVDYYRPAAIDLQMLCNKTAVKYKMKSPALAISCF